MTSKSQNLKEIITDRHKYTEDIKECCCDEYVYITKRVLCVFKFSGYVMEKSLQTYNYNSSS